MLQFISNYNTSPVLVFSFNTSHVVVYHVTDYQNTPVGVLFQYISCCSLSRSKHLYLSLIKVSIHLMLQFIELSCVSVWCRSCVSIHLMLQFILTTGFSTVADGSFNTSHVVVYQISPTIHNIIIQLFQYISCCSLSRISINKGFLFLCFNTSHVVVYPCLIIRSGSSYTSFNTSHVVVYPISERHSSCSA